MAAVLSGVNHFLHCVMKEDESTAIEVGATPPMDDKQAQQTSAHIGSVPGF